MAVGETILSLNGTIGTEPEHRRTDEGAESVSFLLISNERWFDKQSGDWVDGRKLRVRVTCWRKLAANVHASLGKGDHVIVSGRLHTRDYESEGRQRQSTELDAFAIGPNLARCAISLRGRRDQLTTHGQVPSAAA